MTATNERECPECDGPIDSDDDTLVINNCSMAGMGWKHPSDCDTCGAVRCDQSC